ncbi:MAG: DegT/DnrJ/EryC1/StrS family aminotransferase [Brevundimonas sp.]|uniref:DegT/DnrJ/EryC1/StrS family aminotransferase n=1 Tax=Brevundimonas sp. TaxID=1871086 RepID=UPI00391C76E1
MAIQLFVPTFAIEECLSEIRETLERGWTGLGFKTVEFEQAWLRYTRLNHAHFVNSATSGLHLAVNIFKEVDGWCEGDEIITSPLTFVSSNHAIMYEGLKPVFADVDEFLCLDPVDLERKITPRTRAVMFIGLGGNTGQLVRVQDFCKKHGLRLILDAAHMAGTRLSGNTPSADCVVYSFQAVKNLPTADSGMICFAEAAHDEICRKKAWMGINKDTFARTSDKGSYRWLYDVDYVGYKYNGNSVMAAMGLVELRYLDRNNAYRRQIATWYDEGLKDQKGIGRVPVAPDCESSRHLYQIHVDNRDELMLALNGVDIFPGVHYRDNREYKMFSENEDTCPNSTRMSDRILSLPMHMRLTRADVDAVVEAVTKYAG